MNEFKRGNKSLAAPIVSFSKAGRITFMPVAVAKLGLKEGDGIGFAFAQEKGYCYLLVDPNSPIKLAQKGKMAYLGVQNLMLCERIKTYLKAITDSARAKVVSEAPMTAGANKEKAAWQIELVKK